MDIQKIDFLKRRWLPLIAGILFIYIVIGYAADNEQPADDRFRSDTLTVEVAETVLKDYDRSYRATGTLKAKRRAMLRTVVGGPVESVPVDVGDRVEEGDLLMQVREIDYKLALEQTEADLARAQAQVEEANRQRLRMIRLFENGSATEQERDQAVTAHNQALAVRLQAEAARNNALQDLEDSSIRAPYEGVITERLFEPGEYVSAGEAVIEILNLSLLEASLEIPEKYLGLVRKGEVLVEFESAYPPRIANVIAISPKVSSSTRTFTVRVEVENSDMLLSSGQFITVELELQNLMGQISIPSDALVRRDGESYVWKYADGKAQRIRIKDGIQQDGWILVQNGLKAGEQIIISDKNTLNSGYPVRVAEQRIE